MAAALDPNAGLSVPQRASVQRVLENHFFCASAVGQRDAEIVALPSSSQRHR
jgi:hypothetical protein